MEIKFLQALQGKLLHKKSIETLQINLGLKCNLACLHCHVEAGPHRHEELEEGALVAILELIDKHHDQLTTIDLTG